MPMLSDSSAGRLTSATMPSVADLARDLGDLHRSAQLLDVAAADEEVADERAGPVDDEVNFLDRHADRFDGIRPVERHVGLVDAAADADPADAVARCRTGRSRRRPAGSSTSVWSAPPRSSTIVTGRSGRVETSR